METYLNAAIKDVITECPEVGTILAEYDVGCVTCQVGTCLLKDVVAIHDLSPEAEQALMARIAEAVALGAVADGAAVADARPAGAVPGAPEIVPRGLDAVPRAPETEALPTMPAPRAEKKQLKYSPPMKRLVDEHVLIMRWVTLVPAFLEVVDVNDAEDRQLLLDGVDFIRSYADKFHHAKEEDILFGYFDETLEIIQAMLADHELARAHVRQLAEAVDTRDGKGVAIHLGAYAEILSAHIKREDEILYPWMDRELTTTQVGELFSRFAAVDQAAGPGFTERYSAVVARIETATQKVEARR